MAKNKIDFVLPWVDPTDDSWQKERNKYDKAYNLDDKENSTRFRDMKTLKYVLRSIEKNCPWYNKIYLITTGHYPKWLDVSHPKIELITHEELFINKSALPVFNSNAIEMNLVNIEKLSENFIYLNDDMIIWEPLETHRFFKASKPIDFFHHAWIPRNKFYEMIKGKDTWIDALNNNIALINNTSFSSEMHNQQYYHHSYSLKQKISNFLQKNIYKKLFWINHWHHPQPYLKSTIKKVYSTYTNDMIDTSKHKFRSSSDITPYLYRYWHLMTGNFEPYYHDDAVVVRPSSVKSLEGICLEIDNYNHINFICFNDQIGNIDDSEFNHLANALDYYLESKFPDKASFEN
jgi:hypothetical protein